MSGAPSDMVIRTEHDADHAAIRRVVAAAFGSDVEADLVERIRASAEYMPDLALVAVVAGRVVGHVMISGALVRHEGDERPIVMLSPLAVEPELQRRGVGGALVAAVTARATERGEPLVIVEGDPAYYGRFGFEHAAPQGLELPLPGWAPSEAGQVLLLDPAASVPRGRVVYPAAFDGVE